MRRINRFVTEVAAPAFVACWIAYLGYGAVDGAFGYRALAALKKEAAAKRTEVQVLTARREAMAHRADLLNPHSLDPDMIDERARAVLGYARDGDVVIPRAEVERLLKTAP
jgi:cell division protein FtsB